MISLFFGVVLEVVYAPIDNEYNNWSYDTTFTTRIDKVLKDRLLGEAHIRGMSLSEYVRDFLNSAELPDSYIVNLQDKYKQRIDKFLAEEVARGKDKYQVLSNILMSALIYRMDQGKYICGF